MKSHVHWQRVIRTLQPALVIGGIVTYSLMRGYAHPWEFIGYVAGMGALLLWRLLARPSLRRQATVLLLLLVYVLLMPAVADGLLPGMLFVAGLLPPITVLAAALYFGAFRKRSARKASKGGDTLA